MFVIVFDLMNMFFCPLLFLLVKMIEELESFVTDGSVGAIEFASPTPSSSPPKRKRKKREAKIWNLYEEFKNEEDAQQFIENEQIWSIKVTNKPKRDNGTIGTKVIYRCNEIKKSADQQCKVELMLHYPPNCDSVICYKTPFEHEHPFAMKERKVFTAAAKALINSCYDLHVTRDKILEELDAKGFNITPTQLSNYLSRLKKKIFGLPIKTLGDALLWVQARTAVPKNKHKVFVLAYDIREVDEKAHVCIVLTTKYMLKIFNDTDRLHADGTYKLNTGDLPTIVVGTTNIDKSFVPIAIAATTSETNAEYAFVFNSLKDARPRANIR